MNILLLSTFDRAGGAEKVALQLCRAYRERGHDARMYVRYKRTAEPFVHEVDAYAHTTPWAPLLRRLESGVRARPRFRGQFFLVDALRGAAMPRRWFSRWRGLEDFDYPYAWQLATADDSWQPDVIHAHNLHGDYFDLRALGKLSHEIPVVWTLHDAWGLAGHCAYFIDCDRWRDGCGQCPDLERAPAVRRDRTAQNWRRKQLVYSQSHLTVATPSQWLMDCVDQSMLQPAQARVVPYGIDLQLYRPRDKRESRAALGLPQDAFIGLFVAQSGARANPYKDFHTVRKVLDLLAGQAIEKEWLLVCIGGSQFAQEPHLCSTGYISDPEQVARYYSSADVLLHAAHADNYPLVILEALACGVPVVATEVGGIGEQVRDGETGFLVGVDDAEAMARKTMCLIMNPDMCNKMSENAVEYVNRVNDPDRQADAYLGWFDELRDFPRRKWQ